MTSEGEAANWLWLASAWKFIAVTIMGLFTFFSHRMVKDIDDTKDNQTEQRKDFEAFKLHVSETHPNNSDFKEVREDVKAIRQTVTELSLIMGGKRR